MSKLQHPYPIGTPCITINLPEVPNHLFTVKDVVEHPLKPGLKGYQVNEIFWVGDTWYDVVNFEHAKALDNPDDSEVDEMIQLNGLPLHREGLETETLFREMQENGEL